MVCADPVTRVLVTTIFNGLCGSSDACLGDDDITVLTQGKSCSARSYSYFLVKS